ncbi:MAG TPA: hypothetical protein V6C65_04560 [Allocoleopsis sp.]
MGKANWINYALVLAAYAVGGFLGFWNTILTWQYISAGTQSGINLMVALAVSVLMLVAEQFVFNLLFEPDKAIAAMIPQRLYTTPKNPDPTDILVTINYWIMIVLYQIAKVVVPAVLLGGTVGVYWWDYVSTVESLDYSNPMSRIFVAITCVFGTEVGFRMAEELWKWAKLSGNPSFKGAFQGLRQNLGKKGGSPPGPPSPTASQRGGGGVNLDDFLS